MPSSRSRPRQPNQKAARTPIYRHPGVLAALVVLILAAVTIAATRYFDERAEQRAREAARREQRRAITAFEEAIVPIDASLGDISLEMGRAFERIADGSFEPGAVEGSASRWESQLLLALEVVNDLDVPEELEEARALFAYGMSILRDAAETYRAAPGAGEARLRVASAARSTQRDAFFVINLAKHELEQAKKRVGLSSNLTEDLFILDPIPLPETSPLPPAD